MKVGVPRETVPGERRVALVPEAVGKLTKAGTEVVVESGAGTGSGHSDEAYRAAGATVGDRAAAFAADLVVKVQKPSAEEIALLREGAALVATLQPLTNKDAVRALAGKRTTALSMDAIPRAASAASRGPVRAGERRASSATPRGSRSTSAGEGGCTRQTSAASS